jgi:transcriptional regulator with AAA-type ATPase domain
LSSNRNGTTGWIEKANGGVLVLDGFDRLSFDMQASFISLIDSGVFYKIGSLERHPAKIQIVATAQNFEGGVHPELKPRFFPFMVPPLHERRQDISIISTIFHLRS